jgi:hypothetical protein
MNVDSWDRRVTIQLDRPPLGDRHHGKWSSLFNVVKARKRGKYIWSDTRLTCLQIS